MHLDVKILELAKFKFLNVKANECAHAFSPIIPSA